MPSKNPKQKQKPNVSADLTHLPPKKAGPAHFCSAWLRPPPRVAPPAPPTTRKNNLSISSFSADYYDFTNTTPCVHLERANARCHFCVVPFRGYVPNKREKKHIKTNEQLLKQKWINKQKGGKRWETHTHMQISDKKVNKMRNFKQTNY